MFMGAITKDGLDIAEKSREIVKSKIKEVLNEKYDEYTKEQMGIIERVVHATADPEYAKLIAFTDDAIKNGVEAIKNGKPIIVDISMVQAGIRYDNIYNYIKNEEAIKLAKKEQITRAEAAMRLLKDKIDGGIVVIGNAPTALIEVVRLTKEENIKPALIVGAPVGFVKAAESKELLRNSENSSISAIGSKGGTPVAVSIANGIIALSRNEKA
ncbi:cobalt-precorrin-8 methylmutase [Methanococcus voltae]|uniref:Precorrin-8X methylmutase CbiC/CobH n=1 Tax=Methanococcus voltae (strain ATCC BAA-1334 / A3) TaxID=456320 RepID=D7DR11_METV3|nr:cobalt-precorrin-8 methylmutase [Methanococcus voltae]MCS3900948.1 precorrin-8X/cobalt-precorrin-8 methylmutase [Methanococcus voltae]